MSIGMFYLETDMEENFWEYGLQKLPSQFLGKALIAMKLPQTAIKFWGKNMSKIE